LFIRVAEHCAMQIQKRTMNWLPRASMYAEAEAARVKRKAQAQSDIANASSINSSLISAGLSVAGDSVNLTLRIAANRIQTKSTKKVGIV
jgi:hypothetical protein